MPDEVARQMIRDHIAHCDDRMTTLKATLEHIKREIYRLRRRLDTGAALLLAGAGGIIFALIAYIWSTHG